mmetsp:Transcript_84520/g.225875  ORF Transcript_84520/g.225875 Transcript_84520/m.225875 type:complete len:255 (+) Transcript_84520:687-1451(+)
MRGSGYFDNNVVLRGGSAQYGSTAARRYVAARFVSCAWRHAGFADGSNKRRLLAAAAAHQVADPVAAGLVLEQRRREHTLRAGGCWSLRGARAGGDPCGGADSASALGKGSAAPGFCTTAPRAVSLAPKSAPDPDPGVSTPKSSSIAGAPTEHGACAGHCPGEPAGSRGGRPDQPARRHVGPGCRGQAGPVPAVEQPWAGSCAIAKTAGCLRAFFGGGDSICGGGASNLSPRAWGSGSTGSRAGAPTFCSVPGG